ncbi:hypothetical protein GCM10010496_26170 [Streptomyces asoensis]|nr:hypothetical protein GCM10010496_26170 [Streptomyces asoensis]
MPVPVAVLRVLLVVLVLHLLLVVVLVVVHASCIPPRGIQGNGGR